MRMPIGIYVRTKDGYWKGKKRPEHSRFMKGKRYCLELKKFIEW